MFTNRSQEWDLSTWNAHLASFLIGNSVILCLYIVVGIVGNSLVIFVYSCRMKGPKDDRYFIPHLAVMDLVACLFGASYALALNILPVRFQGEYVCKILWFASQAASLTAGFMLVVIALQRYLKVCRPFKFIFTIFWKKILVAVVVLGGILLASPCLIFYGQIEIYNEELNITGWRCSEKRSLYYRTELLAYNILLFVIAISGIACISVLYIFIGSTIYRQLNYRKRVSIVSASKKSGEKRTNSFESNSGNRKRCYRDSLDFDSPAFDYAFCPNSDVEQADDLTSRNSFMPSISTEEPTTRNSLMPSISMEEQTTRNSLMPSVSTEEQTTRNSLMPSISTEEPKRRSFVDELERPLKAIKNNIPKVRSHFSTHRCSWMFMLITIVFIVAFIPRITLMVLESLDVNFWNTLSDSEIVVYLFLYRIYLITNITNPFFYGWFDNSMRKELRLFCCKHKRETWTPKDVKKTVPKVKVSQ